MAGGGRAATWLAEIPNHQDAFLALGQSGGEIPDEINQERVAKVSFSVWANLLKTGSGVGKSGCSGDATSAISSN